MTSLYYKGTEVMRTTETGIWINKKVSIWRIAWALIKYPYYKIKEWIK